MEKQDQINLFSQHIGSSKDMGVEAGQSDTDREAECSKRLLQLLVGRGQTDPEKNVADLMSEAIFIDRSNYFMPRLPEAALDRALASGCGVGTECKAARNVGFKQVVGVEVLSDYVTIARDRFQGDKSIDVLHYDGIRLPFADGSFSFAFSAHVIEHTDSPYTYLRELIRALRPGGFLFLEFPDRYHHTELHTQTPSAEWLPLPLRNLVLHYLASSLSCSPPDKRWLFDEVRRELRPVSVWQIGLWLRLIKAGRVVHSYKPAPGFIRLLIAR